MRYKNDADRIQRGFLEFNVGDLVMVKLLDKRHYKYTQTIFANKKDASRNKPKQPTFELKKTGKRVAEVIIDHRVIQTSKKDHQEYLVKWSGCSSSEENTWGRVKDLGAFKPLHEEYHAKMASRMSPNQMGENVRGRSYT
ncbi:Uncharacterized protein Adt_40293 [Abeliophyllum distichum]|uniref:Chromo domain-containing protein n=1 Tax=Abeliophyllum distichum TaxID=126358 RepID=A0ABD1Q7H9_9LAMI